MDSTFYVTIYDAAQVRSSAPKIIAISAIVFAVAVAALVVWRGRVQPSGVREAMESPLPVICCVAIGAAPIGVLVGVLEGSEHWRLQAALSSGGYELVEGRIQDFVPGDRGAHRDESFSVASRGRRYSYRYSSSFVVPGFHRSAGPMRAGMHVRIADVDGYIARLEVKQGPDEPVLPRRYRGAFTRTELPR